MAFVHHVHDWHRLHATGRMWHRRLVPAWAIMIASSGLIAALTLLASSGSWVVPVGHRAPMSNPSLPRQDAHPITALEHALEWAEIELNQTGTARAKLQVGRRAWELARVLPRHRDAEYRILLRRAADLLADPGVIDIMERDDRILKARVTVELAPAIDVMEIPAHRPV
ncbi:MAG TPA: hypothetical protein VIK52_04225 [Opitutaceae bacterium]